MTGNDVTDSGDNSEDSTPGQPDDGFDYADDWQGDISSWELTEDEEDRRAELHAKVERHIRLGFRIIPLHWMVATGKCSCGEPDCQSPGKHPILGRWQKLPDTPAEEDSRWWRALDDGEINPVDWYPRSNIGILTGEVSDIFVVDVDVKKADGFATLAREEARHPREPIPATLIVDTGSGGRHYYFKMPDFPVGNPKPWGEKAGIDIKGNGGMVVAVPSLSGFGPYTFAADITDASQIGTAPSWILEPIKEKDRQRTEHIRSHPAGDPRQIPADGLTKRQHAYITSALGSAAKKVATAQESSPGRNIVLNEECFDLCSRFVPAGLLSFDDIAAAMQGAGEACGLEPKAVYATIRSAWNGGQRKDRSHELPDFLFEEPGEDNGTYADGLEAPESLTDIATPWLPKDPAAARTGLDPDGRVPMRGDVKADDNPHDVLRLAWAVALGYASPHIATIGRQLVVVSGAERGSLDISDLDPRRLRNLCANGLTYRRHIKKTVEKDQDGKEFEVVEEWEEPSLPSIQLCGTVLADPAIRLYRPVLSGISRVPVLRPEPDVTLLEQQGVDQSTSRIYWPDLPIGPIPASPTRSEVAAAKKFLLDELMHDFPWSSDADRANCLAMWLTSYLQAYAGFLSPLFVVNASKSSSGKGFLVTVMVETTGAYFRSWVNVEEEIRKALTACLMESDPVVVFDDVGKKDTVSSATLASMLTKKQWDDRILGVSKNFRGENNRTWCLTGNNVKLGGDIPSRSVLIHLDPGPGDPKDRDPAKFELGDIGPWLAREENQVKIIRALLILVTDWAAHGCKRSAVHHRFSEWAAVVGGVLEHHKIDGFLANQAEVEQHVHYDEHLGDFFAKWFEQHKDAPQGVKKLRDGLGKDAEEGDFRLWKCTWPRGRKKELLSWRLLARELRDALGQDHGGYQVEEVSDGHGGQAFKVSPVPEPDPANPAGEQKESS